MLLWQKFRATNAKKAVTLPKFRFFLPKYNTSCPNYAIMKSIWIARNPCIYFTRFSTLRILHPAAVSQSGATAPLA